MLPISLNTLYPLKLINYIRSQVSLPEKSIKNTLELLNNDATIPFIARYRKELTGNLDETEIEEISKHLQNFKELEKRKSTILKAIEEQEALSGDLRSKIENALSLSVLEDLYLPFKKSRKTKADTARNKGLEPLAKIILAQIDDNIQNTAKKYLNSEVKNIEEAIEGAKDIIAEWINENTSVRSGLRKIFSRKATIKTKVVKAEEKLERAQKFQQYFNFEESLNRIPSHRFLAIFRAHRDGILRLKIEIDEAEAKELISEKILKRGGGYNRRIIEDAIHDSYKRLLKPSFASEFLTDSKERADKESISVFAENLEQLLLSPPLGGKRILAIDPGFKSGCKVVCLDENGYLLHNENIYPHPPQKEQAMAGKKIKSLVNAYKIEAISIGNGTASRETDNFIRKISFDRQVSVFVVNEAGASVYSASKIARDEFPDYDITVRGAVSIGRRLSDPLAELVKIDPKSIGVGQYQHEVDQVKLKDELDNVIMRCVNRIGVNVNTASPELLNYVSGIGPALSKNIIEFRNKHGAIKSRIDLLKIPRLGAKSYEQAAGFLRIKNGTNPLDNSAVHPERYEVVKEIAKDQKIKVDQLIGNIEILAKIQLEKYCREDLGLLTLKDIIKELEKPGVDPRSKIKEFQFDPSVKSITDLKEGMKLPGIVNNITNFGCFVDIGLKESGLVHISKLANAYVTDVNTVVKLGQQIMATVLEVDKERKRIQLSLID